MGIVYDELFTHVKRLLTNCLHDKAAEHNTFFSELPTFLADQRRTRKANDG